MAGPGLAHLTIERGGATFASADVQVHGDIVDLHIDVAGGCASADARRELLIKIFALPTLHYARVVHAAIPFGDTELLFGLSERLADVHTRRAGATCLIDALLSETPRRSPAV